MQKALAVGIISSALIPPALAVAPEEYWVVQDATTKHCSVVAEKPMALSSIVGSFKTRAEARDTVLARCHDFYHPQRRHSTAGMMSPINYEKAAAANPVAA